MTNSITAVIIGVLLVACVSNTHQPSAENEPDKVISRIDDMSSKPEWVKESEPFRIESGTVYSLGKTTVPGDHRVEAALRVSQNNAKIEIAKAIEQKLESTFQNAEEGTGFDSSQVQYISGEASKLATSGIRLSKQYWEKVATTRDSGERITQYRVYTLVSMPEMEFKKAIIDAIRRSQGKSRISEELAKKAEAQWNRLTQDGDGKASKESVNGASAERIPTSQ